MVRCGGTPWGTKLVTNCTRERISVCSGVMAKRATISLSAEEEQTLRRWARAGTSEHRLVERANVILWPIKERPIWRSLGGWGPGRPGCRSGGRDLVNIGWTVWSMPLARAARPRTIRGPRSGCSLFWTSRRRRATVSDRGRWWHKLWETSATLRSGASCASMTFAFNGDGAGASVPIRNSDPRRLTLWGCI